jgi:hypothetical protein
VCEKTGELIDILWVLESPPSFMVPTLSLDAVNQVERKIPTGNPFLSGKVDRKLHDMTKAWQGNLTVMAPSLETGQKPTHNTMCLSKNGILK